MKTPTGRFCVAKKIGDEMPSGTIFQSRVALKTGDPLPPTDDLVMSRILWLAGLDEQNANTGGRFIYIHGTKHEDKIGTPASCGCVRMRNALHSSIEHQTPKSATAICRLKLGTTLALGVWKVGIFRSNGLMIHPNLVTGTLLPV